MVETDRDPRNRSSGGPTGQPLLYPIFVPYEATFPRWNSDPTQCSRLEWGLMMCFAGALPLGEDQNYRNAIVHYSPLLQDDRTNPFTRESKALSYLCRHLDRDRQQAGQRRRSDDQGYDAWRDFEVMRLLPQSMHLMS